MQGDARRSKEIANDMGHVAVVAKCSLSANGQGDFMERVQPKRGRYEGGDAR